MEEGGGALISSLCSLGSAKQASQSAWGFSNWCCVVRRRYLGCWWGFINTIIQIGGSTVRSSDNALSHKGSAIALH